MPLTPFHLGPPLLIGLLLFPLLDLPAFLVSSVIVDLEPFLYEFILFPLGISLSEFYYTTGGHGFLHTYLGATFIAMLVTIMMFKLREYTYRIAKRFELEQKSSPKKILISSLLGIYFHIFIDSFMHLGMMPFYPLKFNVFYIPSSGDVITVLCFISFILASLFYLSKYKKGLGMWLVIIIFLSLFLVWCWQNPTNRFGYHRSGLTFYSGVPIPYFDLKIHTNGMLSLRTKSHFVSVEEVDDLISEKPDVLIIGIGYDKLVRVDEKILNSTNIKIEALETSKAIRRFNTLRDEGKIVAAIIHSTC